MKVPRNPVEPKRRAMTVRARCLCGAVELEAGVPARWAWHDHSPATRRAHGAAYATYVGCYRSKVRMLQGEENLTRYVEPESGRARSFCASCGAPVFYERPHAPTMVNIPRALFIGGVAREPRYHIGIDELQPWAYTGERLVPLKGFPGVVWERPNKKRARRAGLG